MTSTRTLLRYLLRLHRLACYATLPFLLLLTSTCQPNSRGEVSHVRGKYAWSGSGEAFVPNYMMLDVIGKLYSGDNSTNLAPITEVLVDQFIDIYLEGHGFNGVHVPVYGQWFEMGNPIVSTNDTEVDQATFDKLSMIITKVYQAGGSTHLWLWGDDSRRQTSASLPGGIMGKEEQQLLDQIHLQLGPLQGWTMSYGFDLWEWVNEEQLRKWHNYLWQKDDWNHLLGARASKNELDQLYEGMDYASYEYHKPGYETLRKMKRMRPEKPAFSEDRYRIRTPSKYPKKDYNEEETRRGLWHHTMAGGIGAIWGNLDGTGIYENQATLKCFSIFWNDNQRFKLDMVVDENLSEAYCLTDGKHYVFYHEQTEGFRYQFKGSPKQVIAVDTKESYREINLGTLEADSHTFTAPYPSDWALWLE